MAHRPLVSLRDVEKSAAAIKGYIANTDFETYAADTEKQDTVERRFLIIGEALTRLGQDSPELAARIPGLRQAVGLRNHPAHEYHRTDPETVWDTAVLDLPEMRLTVQTLISELENTPAPENKEDQFSLPSVPDSFKPPSPFD